MAGVEPRLSVSPEAVFLWKFKVALAYYTAVLSMACSYQCDLPIAADGLCYISAIVGQQFSVLVRSDRAAVTCGSNQFGQLTIPDGARCVIRQKLPLVVWYGIVIAWVTCHSRFSRVSDAIPNLRRTLLEFIV